MMVNVSFPRPGVFCSPPTTDYYELEIVKAGGLNPLLRLLQSSDRDSIDTAVLCVSNLSHQPTNHSRIIEAGFLQPLLKLLSSKDHETIQSCAARILRNLAASTETRRNIVDVGAVQSIKKLVLQAPVRIQIEMTHCIKYLSKSGMHSPFNRLPQSHSPLDELKTQLSEMGISEVLNLLTKSPDREVRRLSNATLKNLKKPAAGFWQSLLK